MPRSVSAALAGALHLWGVGASRSCHLPAGKEDDTRRRPGGNERDADPTSDTGRPSLRSGLQQLSLVVLYPRSRLMRNTWIAIVSGLAVMFVFPPASRLLPGVAA